MLNLFKKLGDKISNNMLAPGAEESDGYYDEYDGYYDNEYDNDYYEDSAEPIRYQRTQSSRKPAAKTSVSRDYRGSSANGKNNVYGFTSTAMEIQKQSESVIMHPKNMEDAVAIGSHVRSGRMCIVDLTGVPTSEAQRIADYLCGNSDALDGAITRVNNSIIAVSPPNFRVMPDYREEVSYDTGFLKASSDR